MADEKWRTLRDLIREVTSDHRTADFFQLVRLLERSRCAAEFLPPGMTLRHPPGSSRQLANEAIRFYARMSARFVFSSTGSIDEASRPVDDEPTPVETSFMAAAGAQSVLPNHYTTLILQRLRHGDTALRDYLDLYHHRMIAALVRGWEKSRPYALLESDRDRRFQDEDRDVPRDLFSTSVNAIAGRRGYDEPPGFDEKIPLYFSGIFSDCRRSATPLAAMLEDYLGFKVRIEQFYPIRIRVPEECRWRLPADGPDGKGGAALGYGLMLGESVEIVQTSFLVKIGPLTLSEFHNCLPEGAQFAPLSRLLRYYAGFEFVISAQLLLKADEVPEFRLGGSDQQGGVRLGWETWMHSAAPASDVLEDVVFTVGE